MCINKFRHCLFCILFFIQAVHAGSHLETKIAYLRFSGDYWQVWITDSKGRAHRQITFDKVDKTKVSWSPDSKQLLVDNNAGNLSLIDVQSLNQKTIALDSLEVFDAQLSPDGKHIAYTATTSLQADNAEVWIATIAGTDKKKITNNTAVALSPTWNPKNNSILYSAGAPGKNQELYEVFPETGKNEQLTISKYSSLDPNANAAGQILFSCDQTGQYSIWLLDDKQKKQQLTKPSGFDAQPSWGPDSKSFAFYRIQDTKKQVWIHDIATGDEYPITPESALSRSPAWKR